MFTDRMQLIQLEVEIVEPIFIGCVPAFYVNGEVIRCLSIVKTKIK